MSNKNKNVDRNYIAPIATSPEQEYSQKSPAEYNWFSKKRSYLEHDLLAMHGTISAIYDKANFDKNFFLIFFQKFY